MRPLGYLIGTPVSIFLNYLTASQMNRIAFGNDVGDKIVQAAQVPEGCEANYGLAPAEIEAALTAFSDKHAVQTLTSVRQILGLSPEHQADVATLIAKQLSWHELIHTAYFDVDEFAKLIAYVLHKAELAPLSESFKADSDFEKIKLAHAALPPLVLT
jgi:hypothetical protein